MREQPARMARILGGDEIRRAQHLNGTAGDVAEIADGRCTEIEPSRFVHGDPPSRSFTCFLYTEQTAGCQEK